ncbi:hypothetical protein [Eisenbergiella sp.]
MYNMKKCTSFLIAAFIILGLTACGPKATAGTADPNAGVTNTPGANTQGANVSESDTSASDVPGVNAAETKTPDAQEDVTAADGPARNTAIHISKDYGGNFSADADVLAPDISSAHILTAKRIRFDEQTAVSILFDGKTPQKEAAAADGGISYSDDSASLLLTPGTLYYRTKDCAYYKFPTDSFSADYDINSAGSGLGEVYRQENLGFMTKEEALEAVSLVLKKLSIDVADEVECYAIDSAAMQEQQDKRIKEMSEYMETFGITPTDDKSENDPTYGYQTKDRFTPEDDFYRFYFKVVDNSIPITQKTYTTQAKERGMEGSVVEVSFSKKGIIELRYSAAYRTQSTDAAASQLLSAEEALQKAADICNGSNSADKITVTAVDLEYVPTPYNDSYEDVKLVPAWSLTLQYDTAKPAKGEKDNGKTDSYKKIMFINAVTGEEIR